MFKSLGPARANEPVLTTTTYHHREFAMHTCRARRFALLFLCVGLAALVLGCSVRTSTHRTTNPPARYESVTVDSLNVRSGPGTRHGVIEVVHYGASLEILSRDGNWINVRTPYNSYGWVYGAYITGYPDIHRPASRPSTSGGSESEEFIPDVDVTPPPAGGHEEGAPNEGGEPNQQENSI